MNGPWKLSWTASSYAAFSITAEGSNQSLDKAEAGQSGGVGSSYIPESGDLYIGVYASGPWHLWATPLPSTPSASDNADQGAQSTPPISDATDAPADIQPTDNTASLPSCNADDTDDTLKSAIESSPLGTQESLKVISIDKITTVKTQSGRDLCIADAFTSLGSVKFDYQWISHNGQIYLFERPNSLN